MLDDYFPETTELMKWALLSHTATPPWVALVSCGDMKQLRQWVHTEASGCGFYIVVKRMNCWFDLSHFCFEATGMQLLSSGIWIRTALLQIQIS